MSDKNHVYCAKIALKQRSSKSHFLIDCTTVTMVHFGKFFLGVLLIKIPNEEIILHNDCCKPKKSSSEKFHFKDALFRIFITLVSVTFFWHCLVEIQLLNLKGLEKLDFIKWPYFFDTTNCRAEIFRPTQIKDLDCMTGLCFLQVFPDLPCWKSPENDTKRHQPKL